MTWCITDAWLLYLYVYITMSDPFLPHPMTWYITDAWLLYLYVYITISDPFLFHPMTWYITDAWLLYLYVYITISDPFLPHPMTWYNTDAWLLYLFGPSLKYNFFFLLSQLCFILSYFTFGIILIGVGASIFVTVDNVKFGAWWVGVVMVITSCIMFRRYSSIAAALISLIVALIGAIVDGEGINKFGSITACASQHDISIAVIKYYGQSSNYLLAESCLNSTANLVPDRCYCVSSGSKSCSNQYSVSNNNCDILMATYPTMLRVSCAFCSLCFVAALYRLLGLCVAEDKT